MAELKFGEPFGLDANLIKEIDWELALDRILQDIRSDFIYAPHLALIYARASAELISAISADLKAGKFLPGTPLTIEVPKSFRMKVNVFKRLGPNYSRPGSILLPRDRILYQIFADNAAAIIDARTDKSRSFSHHLAEDDATHMFVPTRVSWSQLQKALFEYSNSKNANYVLKLDISHFFGSINQHTLVNTLVDAEYPKALASRLEVMLTSFAGERSSRGIVQGLYPSDLFGNYYLTPVDRFFDEYDVRSARYVDDMYVFVESVDAADRLLRELIPTLRSYGLILNEAKSTLMPKSALITEEPDLEALFSAAIEEISEQINEQDFDSDYGFQSEWEDEDENEDEETNELELAATKVLFDSISEYTGQEENIERFCLPLFAKAESDYAINHVLESFKKRPSMSQIYTSYLSKFIDEEEVYEFLISLLSDDTLVDWQKMWIIAGLLKRKSGSDDAVKRAWILAKDANKHDGLRAVAAIYVGRFGDIDRRKSLTNIYPNVSSYVQAAIYYSSRRWPPAERSNAKAMWSGQGELNKLLTIAMAK